MEELSRFCTNPANNYRKWKRRQAHTAEALIHEWNVYLMEFLHRGNARRTGLVA